MVRRIIEKYMYEGLGFPVELHNVEMVFVNEQNVPKIDVRAVADEAIENLILQKTKLTGNQIKFIRHYFSFSLRDFSQIINESHTAISKWEAFGNKPTTMDPNIELNIRLYIYDKRFIKTKSDKSRFYDRYREVNQIVSQQVKRSIAG